jgi:hypothetical protein
LKRIARRLGYAELRPSRIQRLIDGATDEDWDTAALLLR